MSNKVKYDIDKCIIYNDLNPNDTLLKIRFYEESWNINNVDFFFSVKSYSNDSFILWNDIVFKDSDKLPVAVLLLNYQIEDDGFLRQIADVYSNSFKKIYGQRPAIYFFSKGILKVAYSLLGEILTVDSIMTREQLEILVANYAIQETITFNYLLRNKEKAKMFYNNNQKTIDFINKSITETIKSAEKYGYKKYLFHYIYSKPEDAKKLPKQLLLLSSMGSVSYEENCHNELQTIKSFLDIKSQQSIQSALKSDDLTGERILDPYDKGVLVWSLLYYGYSVSTDIVTDYSIPCYLDDKMVLIADYAFLNENKKPFLFLIKDTLNLSDNKLLVISDFYSRSSKCKCGTIPTVIFYNNEKVLSKSSSVTYRLDEVNAIPSKSSIFASNQFFTVRDTSIWNYLISQISKILCYSKKDEKQKKMLDLIKNYLKDNKMIFKDTDYINSEYYKIIQHNDIQEEKLWKLFYGDEYYLDQRNEEILLIRTFATNKKIDIYEKNKLTEQTLKNHTNAANTNTNA